MGFNGPIAASLDIIFKVIDRMNVRDKTKCFLSVKRLMDSDIKRIASKTKTKG